jgi:hypothetical protein
MSVYSLQAMMRIAAGSTWRQSPGRSVAVAAGLGLLGLGWPLLGIWPETLEVISGSTSAANRYNFAIETVDQLRQPGDQLLTINPAAGYLYSNQLDYYANQSTEVIIPSSRGWIDRYIGVPYLADVSDFNRVLGQPGDLWFVIDEERLFESLTPAFTQQVLHRMEPIDVLNNVLILREIEGSWPLSESPAVSRSTALENDLKFVGYSVEPSSASPGESIYLTTFWQGGDPFLAYKIFIHLRDANQNNVAQTDFFPLDQLDDELAEEIINQAETDTIRIGAVLTLPPDLPAAEYSLWTGLYAADTLQRLAVITDSQYSNEIQLETVTVRP